ncbi:hypothetical protein ADICYQ_2131 [Cyclobacterium qasimii M12-11B]|uniref:Uncharacterized protein n=1 Tax=Cyclobacterium qasimii M12-11B TaxID=641524 RepID=S7VEW0_9BACT|nr:hypothetical protein ADICYQ_2131 [Cyclobacterium qasimii M12-11B]
MRIKPDFSFDNLGIDFVHLKVDELERIEKLIELKNSASI